MYIVETTYFEIVLLLLVSYFNFSDFFSDLTIVFCLKWVSWEYYVKLTSSMELWARATEASIRVKKNDVMFKLY